MTDQAPSIVQQHQGAPAELSQRSCSPASPGSFQSFGSEASASQQLSAFHQHQHQQQQKQQQQQHQQQQLYEAEALNAQYHAPSSAAGGFPPGQGQSFFGNGDMGGPGALAISAPPPGYSGGHQQQHLGETVSSPTGFQDNSGAYQQVTSQALYGQHDAGGGKPMQAMMQGPGPGALASAQAQQAQQHLEGALQDAGSALGGLDLGANGPYSLHPDGGPTFEQQQAQQHHQQAAEFKAMVNAQNVHNAQMRQMHDLNQAVQAQAQAHEAQQHAMTQQAVALLQGRAHLGQLSDASIQQMVMDAHNAGVNGGMTEAGMHAAMGAAGSANLHAMGFDTQHSGALSTGSGGRPPAGPGGTGSALGMYADPHGAPPRANSTNSTNSGLMFDPQGGAGRAGSAVPNGGLPTAEQIQLLGLLGEQQRSTGMAQAPMELTAMDLPAVGAYETLMNQNVMVLAQMQQDQAMMRQAQAAQAAQNLQNRAVAAQSAAHQKAAQQHAAAHQAAAQQVAQQQMFVNPGLMPPEWQAAGPPPYQNGYDSRAANSSDLAGFSAPMPRVGSAADLANLSLVAAAAMNEMQGFNQGGMQPGLPPLRPEVVRDPQSLPPPRGNPNADMGNIPPPVAKGGGRDTSDMVPVRACDGPAHHTDNRQGSWAPVVEKLRREVTRLSGEVERLEKEVSRQKTLRESERTEFTEAKERLKSSWAVDRDDFARVKDQLKKKNAEHHVQNSRLSQALKDSESTARLLRELCIRNSIALPPDLDGNGGVGGRSDAARVLDDFQSGASNAYPSGSRADGPGDATPPALPPATAEVATQAAPSLALEPPAVVTSSAPADAASHVAPPVSAGLPMDPQSVTVAAQAIAVAALQHLSVPLADASKAAPPAEPAAPGSEAPSVPFPPASEGSDMNVSAAAAAATAAAALGQLAVALASQAPQPATAPSSEARSSFDSDMAGPERLAAANAAAANAAAAPPAQPSPRAAIGQMPPLAPPTGESGRVLDGGSAPSQS